MVKESVLRRETEITEQIEKALLAHLEAVPFLRVEQIRREAPVGSGKADLLVTTTWPDGDLLLVVEVKTVGYPRLAREAIQQLRRYRTAIPGAYGILGAPYISPQTAEICTQAGVGFVDLAGNCLLSFGTVYIRQAGRPNPFAHRRELRSLYSPKAERVLRVLLSQPGAVWKLKELAAEADVSLGQAYNVKERLADSEWIRGKPGGLRLSEPEKLLREWAEQYDFRRNRVRDFYWMGSAAEIEAELARVGAREGIHYALTGFSGAARLAPFVRYQRAAAYVQDSIDSLARELGAKEVSSGANLSLIETYDDGVFYGARDIEGDRVASPIQLYLDLNAVRGRGEDAAQALLEQVIRPQWQAVDPNTTIRS